MSNKYQTHWRKRRNKRAVQPYPYSFQKDDRLLFVVDTEKYDLGEVLNWVHAFRQVVDNKFVVFPKSLLYTMIPITGKEYTMLNNLLSRAKKQGDKLGYLIRK
jgi:hypothetical protein